MDLEQVIKKSRPNINQNTLKAYIGNIKKLNKIITKSDEIKNLDFLKDINIVMNALNEKLTTTKKNYLVAVLVVLMSNKNKFEKQIQDYSDKIKDLQNQVNDNYDNNEKSDKQDKNWVDYPEILNLLKKVKKEVTPILQKPQDQLTAKDKDAIQQYLVLYLYSGKAFPITRNDFAEMRIVKETDELDKNKNYFVIKKSGTPYFKLNEFKTAKFKGDIEIPIKDMELRRLINKWTKINGTGFLLVNISTNTPMTPNGISKYLQKIFKKHLNKNISTSLIRSIYTTHKYKGNMSIKEKKQLATEMMNSKGTAETVYNKID
tara:strand:- start:2394 stop:3347 length:954 start_codon:yes stop_codon:yes gene_type:complete